jgi:hypothetical protein
VAVRKGKPDPSPLVGGGLGEVVYRAFLAAQGREADWGQLVRDEYDTAAAWCAAAQAVIAATTERKN